MADDVRSKDFRDDVPLRCLTCGRVVSSGWRCFWCRVEALEQEGKRDG